MYGVMIPGISAGSNHVGASETCTPQVSCPSGPDPLAMPGATISNANASMAQARAWTRRAPFDLSLLLRKEADEHVAACPTSCAGMAFPLRMRRKRRSSASIGWIKVGAHAQRTLLFLGEGLGGTPASVTQITALHCVHKGVANRNLLLAVVRERTCLSLDRGIRPTEPMSHRDDCATAAHSRWARRRRRIPRKERFRPIGSTPCTHGSRGDECPVVAFCGRQDMHRKARATRNVGNIRGDRALGSLGLADRPSGRGPKHGSKDNTGSRCLLIIGRLRPGQRALRSHAHCPALEYPQARL